MKNKKNIIILLIIFLIIVLVIGIILIYALINNSDQDSDVQVDQESNLENIVVAEVEPETNKYIYITSNDIMNSLFNYISEKEDTFNNVEAILSLLDNEFIAENNITENNVMEKLANYKNVSSYSSKEIYTQEITHRQSIRGEYIYIKGILRKDGKEEDIYILLKRDLINSTYNISFIDEEKFNKLKQGEEANTDSEMNIEKNDYNEIYSKMITEYEICLTYFNDYMDTIKNNAIYGYELLDDEYKNSRFETLEEYENYINNIKDRLETIVLREYNISEKNDYTQYACKDQYGNNYIFLNSEAMHYTVILDTYTIDLPEFIEKYDNGNDETKIILNIGKIIEAINNKDYKYVYDKVNKSFKNNNFSNISAFEQFINNNFYNVNEVQNFSYRQEGSVYICTIGLKNLENETEEIKSVTMLVELQDNRNFELSFSM